MKKSYMVEFVFIENGHKCKTAWGGSCLSAVEAEKTARDWFGFDKDGIEVISVKVTEL